MRGGKGGGLDIPQDRPIDAVSISKGYRPLRRYGCKMATGSGKTVVMAMIVAWAIINKAQYPQDRRFSNAILVVCPNLTVKERLQVLLPSHPQNYYEEFEVVPRSLLDQLGKGKFLITNWHAFAPSSGKQEGRKTYTVVNKGEESDVAFANRVLKDLGGSGNLLVLNDEAHHAYRPAAPPITPPSTGGKGKGGDEALKKFPAEERNAIKADKEAATVWISGLDRINATRRVNFCVDLSATPFYIQGSGYEPGSPFPWLVSDFGLVDAIESGIVKIPRVPVDDNTGQPFPKYFHLWRAINDELPASERGTARRKPKPESVLREAEPALQQLAGEWKKTFEEFAQNNYPVPPCLIAVCDNTNIAELLFDYIAKEGRVFPELLQNSKESEPTLRIDSKLLAKAEGIDESKHKKKSSIIRNKEEFKHEEMTRQDIAEALRKKVSTVGKVGETGEQVRCVVSVGMLNEGWDAHNVTQILGLRAFDSQLLCEQVVGRGLRRTNYDDFEQEEYVDVYGIPFEVIPVKRKRVSAPQPVKESTLVQSLKEREAEFKIEFPRVEGFVFEVKQKIKAQFSEHDKLTVEPSKEPTEVIVRPQVGYKIGTPTSLGPGETVTQTRQEFYDSVRRQCIEYEIARRVTNALVGGSGQDSKGPFNRQARHLLFPQVLRVARRYLNEQVEYGDSDRREVGLEKYVQFIVERLCAAIEPDDAHGEIPLLPRIERFRPKGSTSEVLFRTVRPCKGTRKSHVSHVVLDTTTWESSVAFHLETSPYVQAYVKNDHLDFVIPYDYQRQRHNYLPDFLVRLVNGVMLILEVKGYEDEQDRAKYSAIRRWVSAVKHWGEMGRWKFEVCKEPTAVTQLLRELAQDGCD
ncbi:hypothetical protein FJZ31_38935 [Candidatus Poribacteria bacterium]|nr:hypothetical protein [Candidatus Poribacteria bacterium]